MVDSKQQWKAWLYLAPAIVLLLVFTVWPIFNTVRMAFLENYSGLKAAGGQVFEFGIGNFVKVIKYNKFLTCLKNTVLICVLTVPISTILALLIAVVDPFGSPVPFIQSAIRGCRRKGILAITATDTAPLAGAHAPKCRRRPTPDLTSMHCVL